MAYVDTIHPNRRLGTLGAVTAIHLALGYALVTGLVATGTIEPVPRLFATFTPETPQPQPSPQPKPSHSHDRTIVPSATPTTVVPPIEPSFTFAPPTTSGDLIGKATFPGGDGAFPPTPRPTVMPKAPQPIGNRALWVTPNDYPANDLRLGHGGATGVMLSIDTDGKVADCSVIRSSGWPSLDREACDRLQQRARFKPATDAFGAPVSNTYSTTIRWQIPQ